MMNQWKAKDLMTASPIIVKQDQSVGEVVAMFRRKLISGAPVQDDAGTLVGVVTLRDIAFTGMHKADGGESLSGYFVGSDDQVDLENDVEWQLDPDLKVSDIMTPTVFSVDVDTTVAKIADTMLRGRIHRLMVTENNRLVGIVTSHDLLKVVRDSAQVSK
ncbi:MAG: CBS domain-containing protein [Acidobacteriota bacterium]|nr:CBS domain-containing protein [Acidobacteriota bacterium]